MWGLCERGQGRYTVCEWEAVWRGRNTGIEKVGYGQVAWARKYCGGGWDIAWRYVPLPTHPHTFPSGIGQMNGSATKALRCPSPCT